MPKFNFEKPNVKSGSSRVRTPKQASKPEKVNKNIRSNATFNEIKKEIPVEVKEINKTNDSLSSHRIHQIRIDQIDSYQYQSRSKFTKENLSQLADSIKYQGIQEPLTLLRVGDRFQVASGERRLRAAILANLEIVPARVIEEDKEAIINSVITNHLKEDLHILEQARDFQKLLENDIFSNQEELSEKMGLSKTKVSEFLGFLRKIDPVKIDFIINNGPNTRDQIREIAKGKNVIEPKGAFKSALRVSSVTFKNDEFNFNSRNIPSNATKEDLIGLKSFYESEIEKINELL